VVVNLSFRRILTYTTTFLSSNNNPTQVAAKGGSVTSSREPPSSSVLMKPQAEWPYAAVLLELSEVIRPSYRKLMKIHPIESSFAKLRELPGVKPSYAILVTDYSPLIHERRDDGSLILEQSFGSVISAVNKRTTFDVTQEKITEYSLELKQHLLSHQENSSRESENKTVTQQFPVIQALTSASQVLSLTPVESLQLASSQPIVGSNLLKKSRASRNNSDSNIFPLFYKKGDKRISISPLVTPRRLSGQSFLVSPLSPLVSVMQPVPLSLVQQTLALSPIERNKPQTELTYAEVVEVPEVIGPSYRKLIKIPPISSSSAKLIELPDVRPSYATLVEDSSPLIYERKDDDSFILEQSFGSEISAFNTRTTFDVTPEKILENSLELKQPILPHQENSSREPENKPQARLTYAEVVEELPQVIMPTYRELINISPIRSSSAKLIELPDVRPSYATLVEDSPPLIYIYERKDENLFNLEQNFESGMSAFNKSPTFDVTLEKILENSLELKQPILPHQENSSREPENKPQAELAYVEVVELPEVIRPSYGKLVNISPIRPSSAKLRELPDVKPSYATLVEDSSPLIYERKDNDSFILEQSCGSGMSAFNKSPIFDVPLEKIIENSLELKQPLLSHQESSSRESKNKPQAELAYVEVVELPEVIRPSYGKLVNISPIRSPSAKFIELPDVRPSYATLVEDSSPLIYERKNDDSFILTLPFSFEETHTLSTTVTNDPLGESLASKKEKTAIPSKVLCMSFQTKNESANLKLFLKDVTSPNDFDFSSVLSVENTIQTGKKKGIGEVYISLGTERMQQMLNLPCILDVSHQHPQQTGMSLVKSSQKGEREFLPVFEGNSFTQIPSIITASGVYALQFKTNSIKITELGKSFGKNLFLSAVGGRKNAENTRSFTLSLFDSQTREGSKNLSILRTGLFDIMWVSEIVTGLKRLFSLAVENKTIDFINPPPVFFLAVGEKSLTRTLDNFFSSLSAGKGTIVKFFTQPLEDPISPSLVTSEIIPFTHNVVLPAVKTVSLSNLLKPKKIFMTSTPTVLQTVNMLSETPRKNNERFSRFLLSQSSPFPLSLAVPYRLKIPIDSMMIRKIKRGTMNSEINELLQEEVKLEYIENEEEKVDILLQYPYADLIPNAIMSYLFLEKLSNFYQHILLRYSDWGVVECEKYEEAERNFCHEERQFDGLNKAKEKTYKKKVDLEEKLKEHKTEIVDNKINREYILCAIKKGIDDSYSRWFKRLQYREKKLSDEKNVLLSETALSLKEKASQISSLLDKKWKAIQLSQKENDLTYERASKDYELARENVKDIIMSYAKEYTINQNSIELSELAEEIVNLLETTSDGQSMDDIPSHFGDLREELAEAKRKVEFASNERNKVTVELQELEWKLQVIREEIIQLNKEGSAIQQQDWEKEDEINKQLSLIQSTLETGHTIEQWLMYLEKKSEVDILESMGDIKDHLVYMKNTSEIFGESILEFDDDQKNLEKLFETLKKEVIRGQKLHQKQASEEKKLKTLKKKLNKCNCTIDEHRLIKKKVLQELKTKELTLKIAEKTKKKLEQQALCVEKKHFSFMNHITQHTLTPQKVKKYIQFVQDFEQAFTSGEALSFLTPYWQDFASLFDEFLQKGKQVSLKIDFEDISRESNRSISMRIPLRGQRSTEDLFVE